MTFDELRGYTKQEYAALVSNLVAETAARLISARGNSSEIREAITDYIHRGMRARLPSGQLVCSFCLHSPHVLDQTGFQPNERDMITKMFYEILPDIARSYETNAA
jgi:hypothetical protein